MLSGLEKSSDVAEPSGSGECSEISAMGPKAAKCCSSSNLES